MIPAVSMKRPTPDPSQEGNWGNAPRARAIPSWEGRFRAAFQRAGIGVGSGVPGGNEVPSVLTLNLVRRLIALALLAAWLPASSWCLLESSGVLHRQASCCKTPTTAPEEEQGARFCCALAEGHYPARPPAQPLAEPPVLPCSTPACEILPPNSSVATLVPDTGPPPDVGWQFSQRCALPPRAPDFIS
jgi:hypothetical protein